MDSNYLNSMHGNFPPFNLDFSPSFLHSKKLNVQPLILWENILRGCLASKKKENSREKKKAKDTLYFTKCKIYKSWSPGESSPTAQKMKITKQYISGCLPLYSCLTTKESSNWWITRRELGFRSQISEVKYQKTSVANIQKHSGEFRRRTVLKKIVCQTRKSDHRKESKCVPERLLKHYHET